MANSITNLDLISSQQQQKEITFNAVVDAMSKKMLLGRRQKTSVNLTFGYYGGVLNADSVFNISNGIITLTPSATNYIECNPATGVVSVNQVGFSLGYIPMYQVTTSASTWTSYLDKRQNPLYQKTIVLKDEGSLLTKKPTSINFVGTGIAATNIGDDVEITINQNTVDNLNELIDTNILTPLDLQLLRYDNAQLKWVNSAAAGGGTPDPWTYIKTTSDFSVTTATYTAIPGLTFAAAAGKKYEIECKMIITGTAGRTYGTGIESFAAFATGKTSIFMTNSATANATINNSSGTSPQQATGTSTGKDFAFIKCILTTTATGNVNIKMNSEGTSFTATCVAGSILRYREI